MFSQMVMSSLLCLGSNGAVRALPTADSINTTMHCDKEITVKVTPVEQTKQLDLIFVIDDSGSMSTHQANFIANIASMTATLKASGVDTNVGVITTSVGWSATGTAVDGKMVGTRPVLNNSAADFETELAKNLNVGVNGSGTEMPFEALRLALSEPNLSGPNKGFLRTGGSLAVVFLTDAEDQSAMSVQEMDAFLQTIKGPSGYVAVGAIIPTISSSQCPRNNSAMTPVKIEGLIAVSHGTSADLCASDFGAQVKDFGSGVSVQAKRSYALPSMPRDLMSISVKYGSHSFMLGNMKKGWMFDFATQSVIIGPDFDFSVEPIGTEVEIKYIEK